MNSSQSRKILIGVLIAAAGVLSSVQAQSITRAEVLKIAESYVQHRWEASSQNVLHGKDRDGIEVHTPDRDGGRGSPARESWRLNAKNVGVAYKWGGIDSPESFNAGLRAGKAAGDVYTLEKRRRGGAAVSNAAVGIDCSGFICRCWKLRERYSTNSLALICQKLTSPALLQPGDIMNQSGGHVVLFVKWLDGEKNRALFYEAAPFSKTLASERNTKEMLVDRYEPLRYRQIRD
jgi:hypothetical protein